MSRDDEAGPETRTIPRPNRTRLVGAESGLQIGPLLPYDIEAEPGQWIEIPADGDHPAEDCFVMKIHVAHADEAGPLRVLEVMRKPRG